jgi:hypothetical protein
MRLQDILLSNINGSELPPAYDKADFSGPSSKNTHVCDKTPDCRNRNGVGLLTKPFRMLHRGRGPNALCHEFLNLSEDGFGSFTLGNYLLNMPG